MSLPRLKTLHQTESRNSSSKDLRIKFRKIALEQTDKEARKKSITVLRTQRLKTLERFSTVQQKRQYKNQKINLNLIERKLLSGTYDEKKQTSSQLTAIKQRRDQMKVEMALKQKQIEKIKLLIQDVRQSIQEYEKIKEKNDKKLRQLKEQHERQNIKTQNAREYKMMLQNIIKRNRQTNLILSKRCNSLSQHSQHLKNLWSSANISQRETIQKCSAQEYKLHTIIEQSNKKREERNEEVMRYQQKVNKRKEGEIMHLQKSRQYVQKLDNLDYMAAQREFHLVYDKIIANYFVAKLTNLKIINLMSQYTAIQKLYKQIASYKTFDASKPDELVKRFLEHQHEKVKWQEQIKQKQDYFDKLETKSNLLNKNHQALKMQIDRLVSESTSTKSTQIILKEKLQRKQLKKECQEIEQKIVFIKSYIHKMLGKMNQKGQKNIYKGNQSTLNNLILLTKTMRDIFKAFA